LNILLNLRQIYCHASPSPRTGTAQKYTSNVLSDRLSFTGSIPKVFFFDIYFWDFTAFWKWRCVFDPLGFLIHQTLSTKIIMMHS